MWTFYIAIYSGANIWNKRQEGRGLQVECYGDPFYGETLVEDNVVAFRTLRSYNMCNLLCRTDLAVFRNNKFCTDEEFGELDVFPDKKPLSCDDTMLKPWEAKGYVDYSEV